jgi:Domain of unknown function (DUF1788)
MNGIESLAQEYERIARMPWDPSLAGPQKVWFAIYDPMQERRLRFRLSDFESPDEMELALQDFAVAVIARVEAWLQAPTVDASTVVGIVGLGSLFGLIHASTVLNAITSAVQGRLLVFFPGRYEGSQYRLLDARPGWNYLAIPITAKREMP